MKSIRCVRRIIPAPEESVRRVVKGAAGWQRKAAGKLIQANGPVPPSHPELRGL